MLNMNVLDFINAHDNWEELLTQPPYCITVKRDGQYILFKYNQLNSDFSESIVRECRGSIFYQNQDGKYECICRAFDKFGNYSEPYVSDIDWTSVCVQEKVDGSLIKLWCHNGGWHISTNGLVNAFSAEINDLEFSFGDLFYEAIGGEDRFKQFCRILDPNYTYMFELVSPKSRLTIFYPETKLYYLGQRDMHTMKEIHRHCCVMEQEYGILFPRVYSLSTLDDCLKYVQSMSRDEEGFVVVDKDFNRMKIKSPEYLMAFHLNNNGAVTVKRIINMIKNNVIDDFLAYCPYYKDDVQKVVNVLNTVTHIMQNNWNTITKSGVPTDRKEFAALATRYRNSDYLFAKYDDPKLNVMDWLMSCFTRKIIRIIKQHERAINHGY